MKTKIATAAMTAASIFFVQSGTAQESKPPAEPAPPSEPAVEGGVRLEVVLPAELAVKNFAAAMADGKLGDALSLLPDSYQEDLSGVIAEFGGSMDPDLWGAIINFGKKTGAVLTKKKKEILGSEIFKSADRDGALGEAYDSVAESASALFGSDAITLESLKEGNVIELLNGPGKEIFEFLRLVPDEDVSGAIEKFAHLRAETVSHDGKTAVLRISTKEEVPTEVEFREVEGRWIPAEMAEEWEGMITDMKEGVASLKSPEFAKEKMSMTMAIGMLSGVVDQVGKAKSSEEIDKMLGGMMGMMGVPAPDPGF